MADAIAWERVRRVVRLIAELRDLGSTEAARLHVVSTLIGDLGATMGVVVLDHHFVPCGKRIEASTHVGFDDTNVEAFTVCLERGRAIHPWLLELMRASEGAEAGVTTTTREGVVASVRTLGASRVEWIAFMRAASNAPFTEEDRNILHLFQLESPRLFLAPIVPLPRRRRHTLECLLTGAADKEIALRLGLSVHTVREYVKSLLRAYGVQSRAELIARHHSETGAARRAMR
jgi:DNA-binding NarL/FixJ family response regulator